MLASELQTLQEGTAEYERVFNQIRELKAKLTADLEGYDSQYQKDLAKQLKDQSALWKSAVGEIESIESTLVSDVLTRRKSMSQSLQQIGLDLVTKELANDIKAFTTKLLLNDQTKALEQGGLLFHLLNQQKAAGATIQSQAQQTAATTAGENARLASQASATAEGKAISASAGMAQVAADAAKAAAGAYSAVAGIPIVGPILAPIAAGVAYAGVSAYESMASLDVGTNYVPRDMIAQIHQGEAVVPKEYNPAADGRGSGGGDTHLHLNMSAFDASGMDRLVHSQSFRDAVASSMNKHINRGGRL
jgi:hypothetical protein